MEGAALFEDDSLGRALALLKAEDLDGAAVKRRGGDQPVTGYISRTDALIDWARRPGEVQWQADHFDGHRSRGGEIEWRWLPGHAWLERVDLAATMLDTELDRRGLEIKYALDYPELGLTGAAVWRLGESLRLTTQARYSDRSTGESGTLVDLRLGWKLARTELFVEGVNLFDERLVEAGFAPLPGRWLYAGAAFRLR